METREGTCPWCEREGQTLGFIVWYFQDMVFTDWACEQCRRAVPAGSERDGGRERGLKTMEAIVEQLDLIYKCLLAICIILGLMLVCGK